MPPPLSEFAGRHLMAEQVLHDRWTMTQLSPALQLHWGFSDGQLMGTQPGASVA
jgi:hypothetical protein